MLHEQRDLPAGVGVEHVHLLAARIIRQLVVGRDMEILGVCVDGIQDDFVANHDIVAARTELVKGHDVEPGPLVSVRIQVDPHCVFFEQRRQSLVHCDVFVGLEVQELNYAAVLDEAAQQLLVLRLILFLLNLCGML